jgi:tRNA modification GTPase
MQPETIAAISTPIGRGGIGIVRLAGPMARSIAQPLLRPVAPLEHAQARFAHVVDPATAEVLDQAIVTLFAAPNSYTGDDVVEIAIHSAPVLLRHLLALCCVGGARLALPGEFTQRAFLAGRIDLTQAEAVHDLIASSTMEQARLAARQMGGSLAHAVEPAKDRLLMLIAALEAGIDFAEDDVDVLPTEQIGSAIAEALGLLRFLESSFARGRILREGLRLAIVGRPNAGKSSLFNRLLERERAIVTATPGTTRDTVSESLSIEGIPIELVDTAGLRDTSDEAERLGIERSRQAIADADVVLLVADATAPLHDEDARLLSELRESGRPVLRARNKADLLDADGLVDAFPAVLTSAVTGQGVDALREEIVRTAGAGPAPESAVLTSLRQHQAVAAAVQALETAQSALASSLPHEVLLLDLYTALRALDELTGATTTDDVLALVFSRFCIGK